MMGWRTATVVFFVYIATVSVLTPGLQARRRILGVAGAAVGLLVMTISRLTPQPILDDWVIPPLMLLLAYWTSGLLFVAPMPRAEHVLVRVDEALRIRRLASAAPRWLAEYLEFAY